MDHCPFCGEEFSRLGQHWSLSHSCSYPQFTKEQIEILTGLMMGDGTLNRKDKNPCVEVSMVSENFLHWLDSKFEYFSRGVCLIKTAEYSARENRRSGFAPNAKAKNYQDLYRWSSRNHPTLSIFTDWYKPNGKTWPDNIDLTSNVLKFWYISDGTLTSDKSIRIALSNEWNSKEKVSNYFSRASLPKPDRWDTYKRDNGNIKADAVWGVDKSKELFDYMGNSVVDFEYKFLE